MTGVFVPLLRRIRHLRDRSPVDVRCPHVPQIVVGGELWDVASGKFVRPLLAKTDTPLVMCISPDGQHVVYGLKHGKIRVVNIRTGKRIVDMTPPEKDDPNVRLHPAGVSFGSEGPRALLRESFEVVSLWDVNSAEVLVRHKARLLKGTTSPDGRFFVTRNWEDTGSSVEEATIYDSKSARKIVSLWEPFDRPDSIKFLPDGEHIAVGIGRKEAELWDLDNGCRRILLSRFWRAIESGNTQASSRRLDRVRLGRRRALRSAYR